MAHQNVTSNESEIQKLTKKVMEAAGGKPLKVSLTGQRREQEAVATLIKEFIFRQISGEGEKSREASSSNSEATGSNVSSNEESSEDIPLTIRDLASLEKKIDDMSKNLAPESK